MPPQLITTALLVISLASLLVTLLFWRKQQYWRDHFIRLDTLLTAQNHILEQQRGQGSQTLLELKNALSEYRANFDQHQLNTLKTLVETLNQNAQTLDKRQEQVSMRIDMQLKEISQQVEKRLTDSFEKSTATFADVVKRLAIIDQAQKKITELSSHVVSLQEVLADKRSRGVFGEIQLNNLIQNLIPASHYSLQHTLSNSKRPDCVLFLPNGLLAIDAKFPLESFQNMTNVNASEFERQNARTQFRQDIKKHITDIASKYIIPNETFDGAVMFIPAESIFAEIHGHFSGLVEEAQKAKVWMVSPTTMMAVLTTALAVLKDAATRKQVHIIQEHLGYLSKDFMRFQKRMDNLARHIDQAQVDVKEVRTSADKITQRFTQIERVELEVVQSDAVLTEQDALELN
jgi:DNA recombination protein RmuC